MRTNYGFKFFLSIQFTMFILFLFTACGGGGGGGGSDDSGGTLSLSYTGSTLKVVVDESNAVEVTSEAVNGGIRGTVFDGLASLTGSTDTSETTRNNSFSTAILLQNAISQLRDSSSSSIGPGKAVYTKQETVNGSCGGYATGRLQIDDVSGSFSGNLSFVSYCDSDVYIDGDADFSGTIDLATDEYASLIIRFDYLESRDTSGSCVFDGSIQMVAQASSITLTMDMYLQDGSSGDVFWINNYQMQVVHYDSFMSVTVSGNFYDPDYGYVTLSTQQVLIIDDYTMTPRSGILIAGGENGSAGGPTSAKLTCYPSALFQVEADTDGDGGYDWESGSQSWDDY